MEKYMKMALELAAKGIGRASPNPLVGAIVVGKAGKVVGKGWHQYYGGRHAELNALRDAGKKAQGADLYVTLEPCNHYGKQPPCTKAILKSGVKKVFVAIKDPHKISNDGAKFLHKHGISVRFGLCAKEAKKQNEFYIKSLAKRRPFITLKIAITEQGFITYGDGKRKPISGKGSFNYVQQLRAEHDAILAGLNTVLMDNPKLAVRGNPALNPVRVILDSLARTPINAKMLNQKGKTIIACTKNAPQKNISALKRKGVKIIIAGEGNFVKLENLMEKLYTAGIRSVLVEPGHKTATSFLESNLFDRIIIIVARRKIREGLLAFSPKRKVKATIKQIMRKGNNTIIVAEK